jgi:Carboxypeptidase regulatory-like domain
MVRKFICVSVSVFVAVVFLSFAATMTWAQATAQISGSVKDQTGAVLPGAEVTATQTATGAKRTAVSDDTGAYILQNLSIGPYTIEAALPGFKTYVQTGIVLQVGTNPIVNAVLEVGQLTDQVEVQADAALAETRSSGVGNVIDNQRVLELPLNGRNPTELIFLAGAAVPTTDNSLNSGVRNYGTVVIQVGGGMNGGLNYLLDGGTHGDPENNLNLPLPFPDALQEFKVEMNGLAAQYGHHAAGTINAVTKSGTNAFHGDVFEFLRNGALNAQNFYATSKDGLKRNQFGGTFGGPIVKNKVFFFVGEQATIQRSTPTVNRSFVPTAKMLAGDFTDFASAACQSGKDVTLRGPFGTNGFARNTVDPKLFSPQSLALVNDPRFPRSADPCGLTTFGGVSNPSEYLTVVRFDYQKSEKHSMLFRYMGARKDQPWDYDGKNILTSSTGQINQRAHTLVFGDTYLIGSGIVNAVHLTGVRTLNPRVHPDVIDLNDLGVKNVWVPFAGHMNLGVGSGLANGINPNGFTVTGVNVQPGYYNSVEGQAADDVSWIRGSHQLGFGAYYSHSVFNANSNVAANPTFTFNGNRTSTIPGVPDGTGLALSDFLLGLPSGFSAGTKSFLYPRQTYFSAYVQDSWKATSHLTVNYGIRWEPFIAPYDGQGRHNYFTYELYTSGYRSASYPLAPVGTVMSGDALAPKNGKYMFNHLAHFVPRLALAWDPKGDGQMVVRAAFGMFSDLPPMWTFYGNGAGSPWNGTTSLSNPTFSDPWNLPSATYTAGYPGGNPLPSTFTKTTPFQLNGAYDNLRQNAKSTYINQWNLSVQRQVGQNWLFAANYLGNEDVHLWGPQIQQDYALYMPGANTGNIPQRKILTLLNPDQGKYYNAIGDLEDGGTGSYNAMLLTVQRRRAKGLTILGNYTWSHCIGDGVVSQPGSGGITPGFRKYNRSNCAGDRKHIVNLSTVVESPRFANNTFRRLFSGWQLSGILKLMSGTSFRVTSGIDTALTGTTDNGRANQVLADAYLPNKSKDGWLDRNAFANPTQTTGICSPVTLSCGYGNAAELRGPGLINLDLGLTRRFQIREGQSLEFRAEAFNAPNHVNPMNPSSALNSLAFGKSVAAADPRIMQLALKYVF